MKVNKKAIIIISVIVSIIVIIIVIALIINKFKNNKVVEDKTQIEKKLEDNFPLLFKSKIPMSLKTTMSVAQDTENEVSGKYKIKVKVPKIEFKTNVANAINQEIYDIFTQKIISILMTKNQPYTSYNVDFFCTKNNDILSLGIKCILKEGRKCGKAYYKNI